MNNAKHLLSFSTLNLVLCIFLGADAALAEASLAKADGNVKVLERVASVVLAQESDALRLANDTVGLKFNLRSHTYSVFLPKTGEIVIENAVMEGNLWDPSQHGAAACRHAWAKVKDAVGEGVRVTFTISFKHIT